MRDRERTRKLALAQEKMIAAKRHLDEIDLRKCSQAQRSSIKEARSGVAAASTAVDNALQAEATTLGGV